MEKITKRIKNGSILVSDGAWGTFLQQKGLQPGECPELWNLILPAHVRDIAQRYIDSGADMIETNSFGGSRIKLAHYGLAHRTAEINRVAAELSRDAAGDDHHVLGSIGPTGKILMTGDISEQELLDAFAEQAEALVSGGADTLCIETMSALDEAIIAINAARQSTKAEIICTFTFEQCADQSFHTMMGTTPVEAAQALISAGADIIGTNCGNGIEQMISIVSQMRSVHQTIPILIHANAGLPVLVDGRNVFPETPEQMALKVPACIAAGARIIGGCCGTTPGHIKAIVNAIAELGAS